MRLMAAAMLMSAFVAPVHAQEDDESSALDRVTVTGSRISNEDLDGTPAISITKQGDYLLQKITLINDTRSEEGRKQEIYATIEKILAKAGGNYDLLSGESYGAVLNKSNYQVDLNKDNSRPDVSRVTLYIRVKITGSTENGDQLVTRLRGFARDSVKIGRTEIEVEKNTALVMNKPERYRYEVIAAISEDSKKITTGLGAGCEIKLSRLDSRIEWGRASATELLLYIPYSMEISGCTTAAK